jgi:DNA-binding CsgD family transcriptional regulator
MMQMRSLEHERRIEAVSKRQHAKLIIVDDACRVIADSIAPSEYELRMLLDDQRTAFRGELQELVRSLVEQCKASGEGHSCSGVIDAHRCFRVTRLDGHPGKWFVVTVEFFRGGDSLSRAARKYQLTPREIDVLAMVLQGASATETATALKITESTVQGYQKRLLVKTKSRNRPAMVANVLDWVGTPLARARREEA